MPEPDALPNWGQDLGRVQREVRAHLRVLSGPEPRRRLQMPERIRVPKFLIRSGLFRRSRRGGDPVERTQPNGYSLARGVPLQWLDHRSLAVVGQAAAANDHEYANVTATGLLAGWGQGSSRSQLERARLSLDALCMAEFRFDVQGFGAVGETMMERFLDRDPHNRNTYRLRPWLRDAWRQAAKRHARYESELFWPVAQRLGGCAYLLYALLEAEDWLQKEAVKDPLDASSLPVRFKSLVLADPMMNLLDLDRIKAGQDQNKTISRSMRQIASRDLRYRAYRIGGHPGRNKVLTVYRQDEKPSPGRSYLGPLCQRCGLPDPKRICCCREEESCGQKACPSCRSS